MSSDLQLTADIIVGIKDKVLEDFEALLTNVHKKMQIVDKEAKDMLSGLPKANKVNKILKDQSQKIAENTKQIKKNTEAKKKNTSEGKKNQTQATKTSASLGKFPAILAKIRVGLGLIEFAAKTAFATIAVPAGVLAGWTYLIKRFADSERASANAAKAIQVSTEYYKALGMVADDAGLSIDNLSDLHEELVNRIGDAKENAKGGSGIAFSMIGLDPRDLESMDRAEAFLTTVNAIQKSTLTDMAKIRLGDELFGGEGNRFLTHLVRTGESLDTLLSRYKEIVFVSDKASRSAQSFSRGFRDTLSIFGSYITEGLEPVFSTLTKAFDYVIDNLITSRKEFTEFARSLGLDLLEAIADLTQYLSLLTSWILQNKESIKRWGKLIFSVTSKIVLVLGYLLNVLSLLDEKTKGYSTVAMSLIAVMLLWGKNTKIVIAWLANLLVLIKVSLIPAIIAFSKTVLTAIASAAASFGALVVSMLPIIATIGLLVTAGWLLYRNWNGVVEGLKSLWDGLSTTLRTLTQPVVAVFNVLETAVKSVWDLFSTGGANIPTIWGTMFNKISSHVRALKEDIKELVNTGKALFGASLEDLESSSNPAAARLIQNMHKNNALMQARNLETSSGASSISNVSNTTHSGGNTINITVEGGDTEEIKRAVIDVVDNY